MLESGDGLLLTGGHYRILREDGGVETGTTDAQGMTHLVKSSRAEALELQLMEEGP